MSKQLVKALLRLHELEKKAMEREADFWRQEVKLNTQAFKEITETNHSLHRELRGAKDEIAALREEVAKARFERDQARVELKAVVEENERLRVSLDGCVMLETRTAPAGKDCQGR